MDEYKDKRYIKEIIKEYNILLESWGSSESWDLNQFKTLENMIFETTKIDVNANTLKRFFQQKTGNPQLATKDALCRFLGYSGYTDFVMKKTKKEEKTKEENASKENEKAKEDSSASILIPEENEVEEVATSISEGPEELPTEVKAASPRESQSTDKPAVHKEDSPKKDADTRLSNAAEKDAESDSYFDEPEY